VYARVRVGNLLKSFIVHGVEWEVEDWHVESGTMQVDEFGLHGFSYPVGFGLQGL
jgi:hypothetical protein